VQWSVMHYEEDGEKIENGKKSFFSLFLSLSLSLSISSNVQVENKKHLLVLCFMPSRHARAFVSIYAYRTV
jgi:hypothetical protein